MKQEIRERILEYIRNKRKRNCFFVIVTMLSFAVSIGTFYALSMPALTLEDLPESIQLVDINGETLPEPTAALSDSDENDAANEETNAKVSPSPMPVPSAVPSASSGSMPSAEPSTNVELAPSASPEITLMPSAEPSASPTPSPSPSASPETSDDGKQYICTADGLEVIVLLDSESEIPEEAELTAVRVTGKNSTSNHTMSLDGIESSLGVSKKGNFEYYILSFTYDGAIYEMPEESKTISIVDTKVGKKYGAKAIYRVTNENGNVDVFGVDDGSVETGRQTITMSLRDSFSGLIVYWYKDAVKTESTTTVNAASTKAFATASDTALAVSARDASFASRTEYTYSADGLEVMAELSQADAIPDDAVLSASRLTSSGDFWGYLSVYLKLLLNGYITSGEAFHIYDIHFERNGHEIEPSSGTVAVAIQDEEIGAGSQTINTFDALHIDNSNNIRKLSVKQPNLHTKSKVEFSVDSFSTFIVLPAGSRLSFDLVEEENDTFTHTSYYNPTRPLGMAGNFHIVAFDTARLQAHTNGNVLAKNLYAGSNFGTNGLPEEVSYIQNYLQVAATSAARTDHLLALGSSNVITLMDNGNAFGVNGTKLDSPYNILQDDDTATLQFVNMNLVEAEFKSIQLSYSALTTNENIVSHLSTTGGNCDLSYIELTDPDKVGVYNITPSQLNQYSYFGVKGFVTGGEGSVIINVDCTGYTGTVQVPNSEMYIDSGWLAFNERTQFIYGHILWNFINCTTDISTQRVYGTLVAPDATITVYQNLNGTIIGENVTIRAESHRDDFVGKLTDYLTVNKVWLDEDDSPLPASEVADYTVEVQPYWSNNNGNTWHSNNSDIFELNSANSWTYTWAQPHHHTYLWRVEETAITDSLGNDISGDFTTGYSDNNTAGITNGLIFVYNKITHTLPNTGGATNKPFIIAGALIMAIALGIFIKIKQTQKGRDAPNTG